MNGYLINDTNLIRHYIELQYFMIKRYCKDTYKSIQFYYTHTHTSMSINSQNFLSSLDAQ